MNGRLRAAFLLRYEDAPVRLAWLDQGCRWDGRQCISERPTMRRLFLASLMFAALAAAGSAFATEAGSSAPGADKIAPVPSSKQTASTKPKKQQPVPLSAAMEATPTAQLPLGSVHTPPPSTQPSWTGVYVGVGGGIGADVGK
jgi:hypothetical protein